MELRFSNFASSNFIFWGRFVFSDVVYVLIPKLFEINLVKIDEVINNEDLKANYNPKIDKYTNENLFTCLDIYLNTFGLLNSNVELLRKVF